MGSAQCPKCGAERAAAATACGKCGLAVERWDGFAASRDTSIPEALTAAWERAVASWSDVAAHEEVMRLVAQHDAYAWAATRYRTRAGDPIADKLLARIRKAVEITMMSGAQARAKESARPYRGTTLMLVTFVLLIVAGLVYAMFSRGRSTEAQPTLQGEMR